MSEDPVKTDPENQVPEYKRIQRECERMAKRVLFIPKNTLKPGVLYADLKGRIYQVAPDGSHRRVRKENGQIITDQRH